MPAESQNQKQALWKKEKNLKILAAIAASKDEEERDAPAPPACDAEGPEDFFSVEDDDKTYAATGKPQEIKRKTSLLHVQPLLDIEENPFDGKNFLYHITVYFMLCFFLQLQVHELHTYISYLTWYYHRIHIFRGNLVTLHG